MGRQTEARHSMADYSVAVHAEGLSAEDERLSRYHGRVGRRRKERAVWPGAAFIVEALLLLVFLAGSLAVLMNLNAEADRTGEASNQLLSAIMMASDSAEEFAADPQAYTRAQSLVANETDANVRYENDLVLVREVTAEPTEAGVMYRAVITVWDQDDVTSLTAPDLEVAAYTVTLADRTAEPVYTVQTASYVSGATVPDTRKPLPSVKGVQAQTADAEQNGEVA